MASFLAASRFSLFFFFFFSCVCYVGQYCTCCRHGLLRNQGSVVACRFDFSFWFFKFLFASFSLVNDPELTSVQQEYTPSTYYSLVFFGSFLLFHYFFVAFLPPPHFSHLLFRFVRFSPVVHLPSLSFSLSSPLFPSLLFSSPPLFFLFFLSLPFHTLLFPFLSLQFCLSLGLGLFRFERFTLD